MLYSIMSVLISTICHPVNSLGDDIRRPVCAGSFYPAEDSSLTHMIEKLENEAKKTSATLSDQRISQTPVKALILPHAGYVYSGPIAAHGSLVLKDRHFDKVIVMAPDHRMGFRNGSVSNCSAYRTPLGDLPVHGDAKKLLELKPLFTTVMDSDKSEHAIEVILPFIQYHVKTFSIIPIVLGPSNVKNYKDAIISIIDGNTLLVASSDLSHYLTYDEAVKKDQETIQMILSSDTDALVKEENRACGIIPVLTLIMIAQEKGWKPFLLNYANSGDTAGQKDRVVGYAAIAYF